MPLPNFLQPYLPPYYSEAPELNLDKKFLRNKLISNILDSGDTKAIKWIFKRYSNKLIKSLVKYPLRNTWHYDSIIYWQSVLNVKVNKITRGNIERYHKKLII